MLTQDNNNILPDVRKIAVLRANALGDFIFILPALSALRKTYPDAEIVLLGRDWHAAFLENRPGPVDRVIAIPHGALGDEANPAISPQEREQFIQSLTGERFDLAIQLHGGGRNSNPFIQRLEARYTAGLKTPDAPPLDRSIPYVYFQSEVLRYLEVVRLVGATTDELEPRLCVTEADLAEANQLVTPNEQPLVALHPGASDPKRRWPVENFARLGDALAESGAKVVVSGSAAEEPLVAKLVSMMRYPALNLAGKLSLGGLTGLLSQCALVTSNDTGPLHLAGAVGSPTVGFYWCLNMITAAQPNRMRHRPLISWQTTCPVCGMDCIHSNCPHQDSLLYGITVDDAIEVCFELLRQAVQSFQNQR